MFKVGDRVRVLTESDRFFGCEGTITKIDNPIRDAIPYFVEFEVKKDGWLNSFEGESELELVGNRPMSVLFTLEEITSFSS